MKTELSKGMLDRLQSFVESIAYRNDRDRRAFQCFIGISLWDFRPLEKELVFQVGRDLGQDDDVIVFDPSGHRKWGRDSVGVQRQWLGRLGKVENGQVGIYMGYVTGCGHALAATRLFDSNYVLCQRITF